MNRRSFFFGIAAIIAGLCDTALGARRKFIAKVLPNRCTGCDDCRILCPGNAIQIMRGKAEILEESCTGCLLCFSVCTFGAIERCEKEQE